MAISNTELIHSPRKPLTSTFPCLQKKPILFKLMTCVFLLTYAASYNDDYDDDSFDSNQRFNRGRLVFD